MKLTDVSIHAKAMITDLTSVNHIVRRRLIDFGVVEGAIISLKKALPFGGPFTIEIDGQWIAIRRKEALNIRVTEAC